jgi:hypothetical protein
MSPAEAYIVSEIRRTLFGDRSTEHAVYIRLLRSLGIETLRNTRLRLMPRKLTRMGPFRWWCEPTETAYGELCLAYDPSTDTLLVYDPYRPRRTLPVVPDVTFEYNGSVSEGLQSAPTGSPHPL